MMFTWLIEHTLLLLPTWFWFMVASAGAVLYFFSGFIQAIPFAQARLAGVSIKYVGLVLLLGGVYLTGGAGVTALWQSEIKEANARVEAAETKSKNANDKLADAVKERNQAIQESKTVVQTKLKRDAVKIDAECRLDPAAVEILNESAQDIKKAKK
jgi:hypothetical protein